jgi:hypothetical protein
MNSANPKLDWVRFVSVLGIVFTVIALGGVGITLIKWNDLYHQHINGSILDVIEPFILVAWIGELICGILILKRRKILGQILILIGFFILVFFALLPAES